MRRAFVSIAFLLIAACAPATTPPAHVVPTGAPQIFPSPTTATSIASPIPTSTQSVDDLIAIIEASDPSSSIYAPGSAAYAQFAETLPKLAALNASNNSAAGELAYAIDFPRRDSPLAAQALISLGPDWVATTLPTLIGHLKNPRPEVRLHSALALSVIGPKGSCALNEVGPLLWDTDPFVRTAAALAVQSLSGVKLVEDAYSISPDELSAPPVAGDIPEGHIVGAAQAWWTNHGSKVNWHPSYDLCDP